MQPGNAPIPGSEDDWPSDLINNTADDSNPVGDGTDPKTRKARAGKVKSLRADAHGNGFQLTPRDISILTFLARYKYATRFQLMRRFGISDDAIRKRLPRLIDQGLLIRRSLIRGSAGVYIPTEAAMRIAGVDLSTVEFKPGTATHTLGIVDLAVVFETAGETVVSEREIRAADSRGVIGRSASNPRDMTDRMALAMQVAAGWDTPEPGTDTLGTTPLYSVPLGGDRTYPHVPDLVLVRQPLPDGTPGSIAIELELNRKTPKEWQNVLRGYRDAPHLGAVHYYSHDRRVALPLGTLIDQMGLGAKIKVKKWVPSESVPLHRDK